MVDFLIKTSVFGFNEIVQSIQMTLSLTLGLAFGIHINIELDGKVSNKISNQDSINQQGITKWLIHNILSQDDHSQMKSSTVL